MRRPGIYGPYKRGERWRLVVVTDGGQSTTVSYATEDDAIAEKQDAEKKLAAQNGVTVALAIDQYETWQKARGLKPNSYTTTRARLTKFLGDVQFTALATLTEAKAKGIYDRWVVKSPTDTHRNMLVECRTFMRWCVSRGWIKRSPFEKVKGEGKRRRGKPQLRIDEARRWMATAMNLAASEPSAVAAMLTVELGMRASEVAGVAVRDLDDNGRLLWIAEAKTEAGRRTVEVTERLHPLLAALAAGKKGTEPLFGPDRTRYWVGYWVQRICELAKVPVVCAHSMRGLHATLSRVAGYTGHGVSAQLGHTSTTVQERHYLQAGTVAAVEQRTALRVLAGGK